MRNLWEAKRRLNQNGVVEGEPYHLRETTTKPERAGERGV
jgi:hypothetical protein